MSIVININSGKDFEPVSEGVHNAVLAKVVDKGIVPTTFGDKHKIMLVWLTDEADENGQTKLVFATYTASLHEKSTLRKAIKAIRGKDIDGDQFDIESLVGAQAQLVIQHNEGHQGKVYANVASYLKPKARVAIPADFKFELKSKGTPETGKAPQSVKAAGGGRAVAAAIGSRPSDDPNFDPFA